MSMNRTTYDPCVYKQELNQSVSPLSFVLDPIQYNNVNKCRMELGIVGGTAVSHISGNLVDLENDLRGQTRPSAQCPAYKYIPHGQGEPIKAYGHADINTAPVHHLAPCQMIDYGSVPKQPALHVDRCPGSTGY
jgi:hypothetical protein